MMADDDENNEVDDLKAGKVAAVRRFRKALDAQDDEAAAEALYDFNTLCEEYREEKDEEAPPKKGGLAALIIGKPAKGGG